MFELRSNNLNHDNGSYLTADDKFSKKYSCYKRAYILEPIRYWIVSGEWNQNDIEILLSHNSHSKDPESPKEIVLNTTLLLLSDDVLNTGLPAALEASYEGLITFDEYIVLVQNIMQARSLGITLPVNVDYEKMLAGVTNRRINVFEGNTYEPDNHMAMGKDNFPHLLPEEKEILEQIVYYRKYRIHYVNRKSYISALESKNNLDLANHTYMDMLAFDESLAEKVYDSYFHQSNNQKLFFIKDVLKCWMTTRYASYEHLMVSLKGLIHLKERVSNNKNSDQIARILDQKFISQINLVVEYHEKLKESMKDKQDEIDYNEVFI